MQVNQEAVEEGDVIRETQLNNTLSGLLVLSLPVDDEKLERFLLSLKKAGK